MKGLGLTISFPIALLGLFSGTIHRAASAQQVGSDRRVDGLPVSFSVPLVLAWTDRFPRLAAGFSGLSLSTRVSPPVTTGLTLRVWNGYTGPESCTFRQTACFAEDETTVLAILAHLEFYPSPRRLIFIRGAAGVSWLREQEAVGNLIRDSRSWPFTMLAGLGWDLCLKRHLFATPLLEVLRTFLHDPAPASSARWMVQVGVALTVR